MIGILTLTLQAIYLLLPAYFANMAPVLFKKWKLFNALDKPIDGGKTLSDRQEMFGSHKTWRGIIAAVVAGVAIALLQSLVSGYPFIKQISLIPYDTPVLLGTLMGLGAILGDLVKSFFKRRLRVPSGKPLIPFDQLDFVIGSLLAIWPFYHAVLSIPTLLLCLTISFILHVATNHIAYFLGIRREKW